MNIEDLMTNPYAWAILSFCTIASLVFAIYTWFKGKRKKQFAYISDSNTIIKKGKEIISNLKVTYDDKIVDNIIITKFTLWNSGNTTIYDSNILNEQPLAISSTNPNTKILDVKIIEESDITNKFKIVNINENRAIINFDFINPKDKVVIQVIHTGIEEFIYIDCRIKENKKSIKMSETSLANLFSYILIITIISFILSIITLIAVFTENSLFKHIKIVIIVIDAIHLLISSDFFITFLIRAKRKTTNSNKKFK